MDLPLNSKEDTRDVIGRLSQLKPYKSISAILFEWLVIFLILYVSQRVSIVWSILWIPLIATRMYALYSLVHEGVHYSITRNKRVNDIITKVFLSLPIFISLKNMRTAHFRHHKYLHTKEDPEYQLLQYEEFEFPMKKSTFLKIVIMDISGINFCRYAFLKLKRGALPKPEVAEMLFYIFSIAIIYSTNNIQAFFLLWAIPYCTFFQTFNRIRAYTEHFNIPDSAKSKTRSLVLSFPLNFLFTPHNLGFHSVHHLYPNVPFYHLKQLNSFVLNLDKQNIYQDYNLKEAISAIFMKGSSNK